MFGRLFKWMLIALLLAAVLWHYRDTEAVRKRRATIETVLSVVGVKEASVRRYWPLEEQNSEGTSPQDSATSATPPDTVPSPWNDFVTRFNPITYLRDRMDAPKPATTP